MPTTAAAAAERGGAWNSKKMSLFLPPFHPPTIPSILPEWPRIPPLCSRCICFSRRAMGMIEWIHQRETSAAALRTALLSLALCVLLEVEPPHCQTHGRNTNSKSLDFPIGPFLFTPASAVWSDPRRTTIIIISLGVLPQTGWCMG